MSSSTVDSRKSHARSAVSNGSRFLPDVDGRSTWVRRARDLVTSHLQDLGGEDETSEAERSLIRRASVLTVELERLEQRFAQAGEACERDLDLYQRTAGNLRRLLESVGLERRVKPIRSLHEHLREAS